MTLPSHFGFSQASLQDYTDCPRRFQLRYALGVQWPAAREAGDEPGTEWERRAQDGAAFHHLVHQHAIGIPTKVLSATVQGRPDLARWWHTYLSSPPQNLPAMRRSEVYLSASISDSRLTARYDLVAIEPGQRAVIVDWKTSHKLPRRAWLEKRWQTLVYRYVLVEAGNQLQKGSPFAPAQVDLVYWFANYPGQVAHFPYDAEQHGAARETLVSTIAEILGKEDEAWSLTEDLQICRYCVYRTLCGREKAVEAETGFETDAEEDPFDFELDLQQIAEVEF